MVTQPLHELDAVAQAHLVAVGRVPSHGPANDAVDRIDGLDDRLNCVVLQRRDEAIDDVGRASPESPFRGVPVLVKDLGCAVAGMPVGNGNRLLHEHRYVATEDSRVVSRLRAAGFAVLGRTNTAEFGSTIATEPTVCGPTHNPWDARLSAGGSSGGSAAAVASGMVPVAHGTDASGSVRIPAAACGVVGFKPSNGIIPLDPLDHGGWSGLSSPGILARSVRDAAGLLAVLADSVAATGGGPRSLDVLVVDAELSAYPENRAVLDTAEELLRSLGHRTRRGTPPFLADHWSFHRRFIRAVGLGLAEELVGWEGLLAIPFDDGDLEPGTRVLADIGRAMDESERTDVARWCAATRRDVASWWDDGPDLLVTPVLESDPAPIGWFTDPDQGGRRTRDAMRFTPYFNVSGDPAMSLPLHRDGERMPIGVQFVAPRGHDVALLAVAREIEALAARELGATPFPFTRQ